MRDGVLVQLGVVQQRFGRDAAPVQADAPEFASLDAGPSFRVGGADGTDVAGGSSANDDEMKWSAPAAFLPGRAILAAEWWDQSGELGNHHGDPGW